MDMPLTRQSNRLLAAVAAALLIGTAAAVAAAGYYLNRPPATAAPSRTFTVPSGESLTGVAQRLHGAGFIRSPVLLRLLARARGAETAIRAGYYRFPADATSDKILDLLMAGSNDLVRVTIPEGWTSNRIAAHLEERDITSAAEFRGAVNSPQLMHSYGIEAATAEGYLFPDTYYFPRGYGAEAVVRHMVDTFFGRLEEIHPGARPDAAVLHDTVILASIVEREYRVPSEAPLIASVFNNRLRSNVRLESCATIVYIITEIQGHEHPERIYEADLDIESAVQHLPLAGIAAGPNCQPRAYRPAGGSVPGGDRISLLRGQGSRHRGTPLLERPERTLRGQGSST